MSGDSAGKRTELPAAHSDDELPRATENPASRVPAQGISPSLLDDYTTADIPMLLHRLYALASQI